MPRKENVWPPIPPSAVWLKTTSRMTSMPAWCIASTISLNSRTCSPRWLAQAKRAFGAKNASVL